MPELPTRYSLENLTSALSNPRMLLGEVHRLGNRINAAYHRGRGRDGVAVAEEDWDVLVVLDGCRYDCYAELTPFPGPVERRRSRGSDSLEFLEANFAGETHHDTVYVTANPHAHRLPDGTFHRIVDLLADDWDADLETVRPETVTERAVAARERYPNKRLIVHYMQPHFPFIGETGREIDQGGIVMHRDDVDEHRNVWTELCYGLVDEDLVRRAYRENLEIAFAAVEDLLDDLAGRTVVTSDHGNLVGDRLGPIPTRGFGHPRGLHVPELLTVPWQVLPADERPEVRADPPEAADAPDEDVVRDRLRNLGYAT